MTHVAIFERSWRGFGKATGSMQEVNIRVHESDGIGR